MDDLGGMWFGSGKGVTYFHDNNTPDSKIDDTWVIFTTADGLVGNYVQVIGIDPVEGKWFGTPGDGLSYLDDGGTPETKSDDTWMTIGTADGLAYVSKVSIAFDADGGKWIGTGNGLYYLDDNGTPLDKGDDQWMVFTQSDGLPGGSIYGIAIDATGAKWIAKLPGVSLLNDGGTPLNKADDSWTNYSVDDGLADWQCRDVTIDSSGGKWIATNGGVSYCP
jgi:ligand-binding sensor domain-containing protein